MGVFAGHLANTEDLVKSVEEPLGHLVLAEGLQEELKLLDTHKAISV